MNVLKKWFGQGQTEFTGLDIGTSSVKLIALQKNSQRWTVTSAARAAIDPAEDPAICQENTLKAIRECFKAAGPETPRNVVCGISGQSVSVRGFKFPPLPNETLEQAVKLEAQQTCALDIAHSVIDFQLLEDQHSDQNQKQGRKGYFVACLQDAVNYKVQLAQQAQAKTCLMDIDSLAILNCLCAMPENQTTEVIAAMDIGHSTATITILGSDGVPFVRILSGSGQQILKAMQIKTQLSAAEIKKGLLEDTLEENDILQAELKSAAAKMLNDAIETLRFYSLQNGTSKISRLYLCGGFSLYKPFVHLIQQHLPAACEVFDPFSVLQCPDKTEIKNVLNQFGPAMTVAAGLAMRSINHVHN